jgi:hypothetical protein
LTTVCLYALSFRSLTYPCVTVMTLRSISHSYNIYEDERDDRAHVASRIYNAIPLHYRQVLDRLLQAKNLLYSDRTRISHPTVKKSEISAFLIPHLAQQANPAMDLLRNVQDAKVIDSVSGQLVPMFQEG